MTFRKLVSLSAVATALFASQSAYASDQDNAGTTDTEQANVPSDEQAAGVEDIVVTANKQSQSLQKAPVAITAISGAQIVSSGITDIRAAQAFVPSVRFQAQNTVTELYIRGVGQTQDHAQFDPPIASLYNGVYLPREVASAPFYDISQVEVLPGPQGTLYGRSSLGGVVNVNFNRPTNANEAHFVAEAGNYSMYHITSTVNAALTDTLAVRGSFDFNRHSGYMTSGSYSKNGWSGRLSALYRPNERVSVYLWGMEGRESGNATNAVAYGVLPDGTLAPGKFTQSDPWNDLIEPTVLAQYGLSQPTPQPVIYRNRIVGGEIEVGLSDDIKLTYIPSYLKFYSSNRLSFTGLPNVQDIGYEQTTHELRLAGKAKWGNWLLGLYGYRMTSFGNFYIGTYDFSGVPVTVIDHNRLKGAAVFGQGTINLSDSLRLTVGGRYGADDRIGNGPYAEGANLLQYNFSHSYRRFDYKVGVDYDIAPHAMIYAALQTGYAPGTFNTFADPGSTTGKANPVNPAKLTAYTAGLKSRLLDGKLQFNNEFFYYDYRDIFATAYNAFLSQTQAFNADKTEIYGNQTDFIFKPSPEDQLNISLGYLHARYKRFTLPDGSAKYDGKRLPFAPDWTVSGGYYHDFLMSKGYLRANVSGRYESSFYPDFTSLPGAVQKAYVKVDASITYYDDDERWSLGLWGKNLTNKAVIAAAGAGSIFPPNPNAATAFLEDPRTFGLRATLKY